MEKKRFGGAKSSSQVYKGHLASQIPSKISLNGVDNIGETENLSYELNNEAVLKAEKKIQSHDLETIQTPILEALSNSLKNPTVPLHIPGHAKGEGILPKFKELTGQRLIELDTTDEFNGLGKLTPADGPIQQAQLLAAEAFGSQKAFFLINGSTVGNLALALTVAKENTKIIIGRNCHRSVISGLTLTGAEPVWVVPQKLDNWGIWGAVSAGEIESVLDKNPDAGVVWINNPTYEGVVSDIEAISKICKSRDIMLIVDEAHGCAWKFSPNLPKPALECGADAVVHSLHKTGGSFSQSSILHIGKNSKINIEEVEANLGMLQSTSPSYMLLASLDAARGYLTSAYGQERLEKALRNANETRTFLQNLKGVRVLSPEKGMEIDPTKIYVQIAGLSGKRLESILEIEYGITVEAATDEGILALSGIGNTAQELYAFCDAIKKISKGGYSDITYLEHIKYMPLNVPEIVCTPRKAYISLKEKVLPQDSVGRICAEVIAICPPGIPVLVPGEKINAGHLDFLAKFASIQVIK